MRHKYTVIVDSEDPNTFNAVKAQLDSLRVKNGERIQIVDEEDEAEEILKKLRARRAERGETGDECVDEVEPGYSASDEEADRILAEVSARRRAMRQEKS